MTAAANLVALLGVAALLGLIACGGGDPLSLAALTAAAAGLVLVADEPTRRRPPR